MLRNVKRGLKPGGVWFKLGDSGAWESMRHVELNSVATKRDAISHAESTTTPIFKMKKQTKCLNFEMFNYNGTLY